MINFLGFGMRMGIGKGGAGAAYASASLVLDPYGVAGSPYYKYVDGSTYSTFAALVAASKATYTRSGAGTAYRRDGSLSQFITDAPRETNAGLTIEEARTNYFLNSGAPVTQVITATAASYVLSVIGSGSATVVATTAVGSGFGIATAGSPVAFTISVGGTITVTITGSLTQVDVQQGVATFPLTPIITTAASATRAIDSAFLTGLGTLLSGNVTILSEVALTNGDGLTRVSAEINDGTSTNRVAFRRAATNASVCDVVTAGVLQNSTSFAGKTGARILKNAIKISATSSTQACDGVLAASEAITKPSGMNRIDLGQRFGGATPLDSPIRRIVIWPYAMTDAQLQAITA